jgi:prepilin peptidase CpaA
MNVEWILLIFVGLLVAAALQDMLTLRISNLFPLALFLTFGLWVSLVGWPYNWWENLIHFGLALGVGMILFAMRWVGGGDAKLYASCALWFNLQAGIQLLFFVSISGLLLLVLMLAVRKLRKAPATEMARSPATGKKPQMQMPYGVAIAVGTLATLYLAGVNPPADKPFDPAAVQMPADILNSGD